MTEQQSSAQQINLNKNKEARRVLEYAIIGLGALYLAVRFALTKQLDALGPYSSYIFEVVCSIIAIGLYSKEFLGALRPAPGIARGVVLALVSGFGIFEIAKRSSLGIPFDLKDKETIIFLLLLGPLLEEVIFRFFLWQVSRSLLKLPFTLVITSLIFSYSHFHAFWFVPSAIHPFIIYQTIYTLGLGLWCGFYLYRHFSLGSAIIIHLGFNLGFFVGSLF